MIESSDVAWREQRIVDDYDDSSLAPIERARLATQQSSRRRAEFVAGRIAARAAIASLVGDVPFAIDRDDDGAPRIVGVDHVALSITHGQRHAHAVAARAVTAIGVDLCDASDAERIRRVARRAFPRPHERALALADDRAACTAWAMKEAAAKALRIGMLEGRADRAGIAGVTRLEVIAIDPPQLTLDDAPLFVELRVRDADGGVLVLATLR